MKTKVWLKAFRLRTLPLAFSVIVAGTALVYTKPVFSSAQGLRDLIDIFEHQKSAFRPDLFFLTLLTTLFLQVLSNLANDYGDFSKGTDDQNRVGPERSLQSGAITKKQMMAAIIIFTLLSFVSGTCLLYLAFGPEQFKTILVFLAIGILCIAAAIKYTVGKGAYGYNALGDIAVFVFFGGVGVLGSFYLQTHYINILPLLIAIAYGLWCTAVLNLNNMRDVDNDIVHKKFTVAYLLGFKGAKIYQAVLVLVPYALVYWVASMYLGQLKALLVLLPLPLSIMMVIGVMKVKERRDFDKFLKIQALVTFLNSIVLFSSLYLLYG